MLQTLLSSPASKWAVGGWSLFIAENLILSENRSKIMEMVGGDDNYHYLYGTLSSVAMASTGYGYFYHVRNAQPLLCSSAKCMPMPFKVGGLICLSMGFGIASQTAPKAQIPITMNNNNNTLTTTNTDSGNKWKVRCPFDFTDSRSATHIDNNNDGSNSNGGGEMVKLSTADRISRHPGLFSFGLVSLGYGLLLPSLPTQLFFSMPLLVAVVGGAHTDSRHRRGMGGQLSPAIEQQTSLLPFYALLTNDDNNVIRNLQEFWTHDVKGINLALSIGLASLIVLRKGRSINTHIHHTTTTSSSSLRKSLIPQ